MKFTKTLLLFLAFSFGYQGAVAQTFTVSDENPEAWSFVMNSWDFPTYINNGIQIYSNSTSTLDLRWKRLVNDTPADWSYNCDFFFQNVYNCLESQGEVTLDSGATEFIDVSFEITGSTSILTDTSTLVYLLYDANDSLNSHYELTFTSVLEFPELPEQSFSFESDTIYEVFMPYSPIDFPIPSYLSLWINNNDPFNELNLAWEVISVDVPSEWVTYCNFGGSDCENASGQTTLFPESQEVIDFHFTVDEVGDTSDQAVHRFLFYDVSDSLNNHQIVTFITDVQLPPPSDQSFTFFPEQDTLFQYIDVIPGEPLPPVFFEPLEMINNTFGSLEIGWKKLQDSRPSEWTMNFDLIFPGENYYYNEIPDGGQFSYDFTLINLMEYYVLELDPNGVAGTSILQMHFYDMNDSLASNETITYIFTVCPGEISTGLIQPLSNTEYCSGDLIEINAVPGFSNYEWSTGETGMSITTEVGSVVGLMAEGEEGCIYSDEIFLDITQPHQENICLVTVNPDNGKNQIIWERTAMVNSEYFNIHRQTNQSGVFEVIGSLPFDSLSTFTDEITDPQQSSEFYAISVVDSCGNESPLSSAHKTLHLTINQGINGQINLIWDPYEGFDYSTFNILRGSSPSNMQMIAQKASDLFSFTDTPPAGPLFYQVEIVKSDICDPTLGPSTFVSTLSNIVENQTTSTSKTFSDNQIRMFPNPSNELVTIQVPWTSGNYEILIEDITGRVLQHKRSVELPNIKMNVSDLANGIYYLRLKGAKGSFSDKLIIQR